MNTKELKDAAKKFGADLVGIAPIKCFAHLPPENNPLSIFPQAKSLIVIGRKIPRGIFQKFKDMNKQKGAFQMFGLYLLEDNFLAKTTYDINIWMEAQGYEAVPLFGYDAEAAAKQPLGAPVADGKPAPNVYVDWAFAAKCAGLGEIGKNGLFLTPEYGTRQRFALLLSDFEFDADQEIAPGFCKNCSACIEVCPLKALSETGRDNEKCKKCEFGAIQTGFGRFHNVDRIPAVCGLACLKSLESRGLLSDKTCNNSIQR